MADAFDYDPETGEWFVKDSDGDYVLSSKATMSRRYTGVDEFFGGGRSGFMAEQPPVARPGRPMKDCW